MEDTGHRKMWISGRMWIMVKTYETWQVVN